MHRALIAVVLAATLVACADGTDDPTGDPAAAPSAEEPDDTSATDLPAATTSTTAVAGTAATAPDPSGTAPDSEPPELVPATTAPDGDDEAWFAGRVDPGLAPLVDLAVADLAARLGVPDEDIATVSAVEVTWRDASLGCPEPDMVYAQVIEDGSLVELEHDGTIHRYHSGGSRTPFLCESPVMPALAVDGTDAG